MEFTHDATIEARMAGNNELKTAPSTDVCASLLFEEVDSPPPLRNKQSVRALNKKAMETAEATAPFRVDTLVAQEKSNTAGTAQSTEQDKSAPGSEKWKEQVKSTADTISMLMQSSRLGDRAATQLLNNAFRELRKDPQFEYAVMNEINKGTNRPARRWLELEPVKPVSEAAAKQGEKLLSEVAALTEKGDFDNLRSALTTGIRELYRLHGLDCVTRFIHDYNARLSKYNLVMREDRDTQQLYERHREPGIPIPDSCWLMRVISKSSGAEVVENSLGLRRK